MEQSNKGMNSYKYVLRKDSCIYIHIYVYVYIYIHNNILYSSNILKPIFLSNRKDCLFMAPCCTYITIVFQTFSFFKSVQFYLNGTVKPKLSNFYNFLFIYFFFKCSEEHFYFIATVSGCDGRNRTRRAPCWVRRLPLGTFSALLFSHVKVTALTGDFRHRLRGVSGRLSRLFRPENA